MSIFCLRYFWIASAFDLLTNLHFPHYSRIPHRLITNWEGFQFFFLLMSQLSPIADSY